MTTAVPAAGWAGAALGLAASLLLAVLGFRAQHHPDRVRHARLRATVWCQAAGAVLAMAALEIALITDNFAVSYVAETHSRATPPRAWSSAPGPYPIL